MYCQQSAEVSTGISILASRTIGVYTRPPSGWTVEAQLFVPGCLWPPQDHQFWPSGVGGPPGQPLPEAISQTPHRLEPPC
jgi:hypothetical protein